MAEDLKARLRDLVRGIVAKPYEAPVSPREFVHELLRCPTCGVRRTESREETFLAVMNKIAVHLEAQPGRCPTCGAPLPVDEPASSPRRERVRVER